MLLRSALDQDPDAVVVSIDGIGAYDHVSRAAVFEKLLSSPALHGLVPFVRMWYARQSTYLWQDDAGNVRHVPQGEGVEQGDALAPALFALAIHDALGSASGQLQSGEFLVAYLDDVYIKTTRERARAAFDTVTGHLLNHAQIDTNLGKCRVYGRREVPAPADLRTLGAEVWRSDAAAQDRGVKVLGTPIGSAEFVRAHLVARAHDEQVLLERLTRLPDPQCAWLVLMYCASARANHLLRTVPPGEVLEYAHEHDRCMWACLHAILGNPGLDAAATARAQALATVPRRHGGLGLQNAGRSSTGAYWAAWADALHMLHQRRPAEAQQLAQLLSGDQPGASGGVAAAEAAGRRLDAIGMARPSWAALLAGERPSRPNREDEAEAGEWKHGWQFHACSRLNTHYRENVLLPSLQSQHQAMLRSGSGRQAGCWLQTLPVCPGTRMEPALFQVALRRRLRLPLPLAHRTCGQITGHGCRNQLDALGDHLAACPRTGLLARRANPLERTWTRVAREGGARVAHKQLLRDTNVPLADPQDLRQLDMVAYGISRDGVPLCCDASMVSPLDRAGRPIPRAASTNAVAIARAEQRKRRRYPELINSPYGRLVVLACEVGGRWNEAALALVAQLAREKCRNAPALLRQAARASWLVRWWGLLSVAAQSALAATLGGSAPLALGALPGSDEPLLSEVLEVGCASPSVSRMPLR